MKTLHILISILFLIKFNTNAQTTIGADTVFALVQNMPSFPGGDVELSSFLTKNFDFSKIIKEEKCFYTLIIGKTGEIVNVNKLKGDPDNEQQIISILKKTSGKWSPPSQNGHSVIVIQPVTIQVSKNQITVKTLSTPLPVKGYSGDQVGDYIPPRFPNGIKALSTYAQTYMNYPNSALEQGIQGVVNTVIYINKEGKVKLVRANGVNVEFNNEAKRVLKLSPNWEPGSKNGIVIDTMVNMKVYFCLEKADPKVTENDICIIMYSEPLKPEDFEKSEREQKQRKVKLENAKKLNEEGSVLLKEKHFEEALEKFNEAIRIAGNLNAFLYNRGLTYLNLKQDNKAKEDFLEAYRQGDEDSGKIYNDLFK